MTAASIVSILVAILFAILVSQGVLPTVTVDDSNVDSTFSFEYFPWVLLMGSSSFCITLRYWHLIPQWFGFGHSYFFDKLCIHQTDKDLKVAGILSFAAFVDHSKEFLLLWDVSYFTRLWCILEVAALVRSCDRGDLQSRQLPLVFMPVRLAHVSAIGLLCTLFIQVTYELNKCAGYVLPVEAVVGLTLLIALTKLSFLMREYLQSRSTLALALSVFKVREAECAQENDRELVNATIVEWFGTLDKFDEHVRTTVKNKVLATIGPVLHWLDAFVWAPYLELSIVFRNEMM
jgi:hypothetical protein